MEKSKSNSIYLVMILFLCILNGILLKKWVQKDIRAVAWDQAIHTEIAYEYQDRLNNFKDIFSLLRPAVFKYPPLFHFSLIPALKLVDDPADAGAIVNFVYFCVLVFSVFLIGRIFMPPLPAFTAVLVLISYPFLFDIETQNLIDFSLTSWVTLGILFLLKSEGFSKPLYSILFGLSLGFGMLTKWTALAYLIGPLALETLRVFKHKHWKWFLLSFISAGVVLAPWYCFNLIPSLIRIGSVSGESPASGFILKGASNIFWYPIGLLEQTNIFLAILFVPGILMAFFKPSLRPLAAWYLVSIILFTSITNKNIRYSMPTLPAVALLSVVWLPQRKRWPFIVLGLVALVFFVHAHVQSKKAAFVHDWKHREIINRVSELKENNFSRITVVSNAPHFHSTSFNVSSRNMNAYDMAFRGLPKKRWFEFADFVLTKTGDLGPGFTSGVFNDAAALIFNKASWFNRVYKEKGRWPLPDGSEAVLFQNLMDVQRTYELPDLQVDLQIFEMPNILATNFSLRAIPTEKPGDTLIGKFKEVRIKCEKLLFKKIEFENVEVRLVSPQINLPYFSETRELQFLKIESLIPQAQISSNSLILYSQKKLKWLKDPALNFKDGVITVSGKAANLPVRIGMEIKIQNNFLITKLKELRVAHVPLPKVFFRALTDQTVDLNKNQEMPFTLKMKDLIMDNDKLLIQ